MDNFKFEGNLTARDYIKANNAVLLKSSAIIIFITLIVGITILLCIPYMLSGRGLNNFTIFVFLIFIFIIYFILRPIMITTNFKKSKKMQDKVTWIINSEIIIIKTEDTEVKYKWEEYKKYFETKNYFFIQLKIPKNMTRFIPKRFIENQNIENDFRNLLKKVIH